MSKETNNLPQQRDYNAIIIVVTIVLLAVIFMFFRDRQQRRQNRLERPEIQIDVLEEWGPTRQNRASKGGGKIL